jgi:hypothetical protein
MGTRRGLTVLAASAAVGMCASAAADGTAGSIVYIRDANVWLARPDGTGAVQVTTDGTAGLPYRAVSQSDAGVILALRGAPGQPYRFLRLAQNGTPLAPPFEASTPTPPTGAEVSPDGSLLAYSFTTDCDPGPSILVCSRIVFSRADRFTDTATLDDGTYDNLDPSWVDDHTIIAANQAEVWFDQVGPPQEAKWWGDGDAINDPPVTFSNPPHNLAEPDLSRTGGSLAVVYGDRKEKLRVLSTNGPPPAVPTTRCEISGPAGEFGHPTWNPDGTSLAWTEADGVHALNFSNLATCAGTVGGLVIPGATSPDWGPAPVAPAPRPPGGPPGPGQAGSTRGSATFTIGGAAHAPRVRVVTTKGRQFVLVTLGGTVRLPAGIAAGTGCRGRLTLVARSGRRVVATRTRSLKGSCSPRLTLRIPGSAVHARRLSLRLEFAGNSSVAGFEVRTTARVPRR